jgi:hypothetical protein
VTALSVYASWKTGMSMLIPPTNRYNSVSFGRFGMVHCKKVQQSRTGPIQNQCIARFS